MVDGPNNCFPPRAPPEAGLAADHIMGAANHGLYRFAARHQGRSKFRPSGPGTIGKHGILHSGKVADRHIEQRFPHSNNPPTAGRTFRTVTQPENHFFLS
jgi:hypothetical protein